MTKQKEINCNYCGKPFNVDLIKECNKVSGMRNGSGLLYFCKYCKNTVFQILKCPNCSCVTIGDFTDISVKENSCVYCGLVKIENRKIQLDSSGFGLGVLTIVLLFILGMIFIFIRKF